MFSWKIRTFLSDPKLLNGSVVCRDSRIFHNFCGVSKGLNCYHSKDKGLIHQQLKKAHIWNFLERLQLFPRTQNHVSPPLRVAQSHTCNLQSAPSDMEGRCSCNEAKALEWKCRLLICFKVSGVLHSTALYLQPIVIYFLTLNCPALPMLTVQLYVTICTTIRHQTNCTSTLQFQSMAVAIEPSINAVVNSVLN